tara:strand:- start:1589 stop:1972 length:384 start_codon:yes stop_codon:yes gene_type:complete
LTDKRSEKYYELESNNNVEICWFFSKSKCQFRLRGTSRIYYGEDTLGHWNQLNDNSKSMWTWPKPGDIFIGEEPVGSSSNKELKFNTNFILIKISIIHVDQLILQKPIHIRKRWEKSNNWIEERINP